MRPVVKVTIESVGALRRPEGRRGFAVLLGCALAWSAGCSRTADDAAPRELIDAGWRNYRLGEFKTAAGEFERAVERLPPGQPLRVQAAFGLATTLNLRLPVADQDRDAAAALYAEVLRADPDGELAPWSALALARMEHLAPVGAEPDYAAVREAYRTRVMIPYRGHPAAQEAALYLYSTYLLTMDPADARVAREGLERFIADYPASGFRSAAHTLASRSCATLGDADARLAHALLALETMEEDPRNPFYDYAYRYWKLATIAEFETGDFATARRYYTMLIEEYPQDIRVFAARQALDRMQQVEAGLREELREASG